MSFIVYFNINLLLCLMYVLVFHVTLKKEDYYYYYLSLKEEYCRIQWETKINYYKITTNTNL